MKSITAIALKQLFSSNTTIQLIDVRERDEHEAFNIGGDLIPLSQITKHLEKIEKDRPVVIYCRKGIRSQLAIQRLQNKIPFTNLINLTGGLDSWKKQVK
jgi:rhodanese-related sulfurtransferase